MTLLYFHLVKSFLYSRYTDFWHLNLELRGGDICVPVMQINLFDSRVNQLFGMISINRGLVQPRIT